MRVNWKKAAVASLMLVSVVVAGPAVAAAAGATLYELTENMKLVGGKVVHRKATSELMGTAKVGTPICPAALVAAVSPGATTCTINATGFDNISTATGLGNFSGTLTVVVQGDNPFDSPEFVVAKGKFKGKMDFSLAVLFGIPLGNVVGEVALDGFGGPAPFTGTFRLPFAANFIGGRATVCPLTLTANPFATAYGGFDLAYLDTTNGAPNGSCIDIQPNELSLGFPTVRFEIKF